MIKVNKDKELRSSPFGSSNKSLSTVVTLKGKAVVELVLVIKDICLEEFLIATFRSHCVSSILLQRGNVQWLLWGKKRERKNLMEVYVNESKARLSAQVDEKCMCFKCLKTLQKCNNSNGFSRAFIP